MAEFVRTFIAIKIPPTPELTALLQEFGKMGRAVRAVADRGLHVTLKFLGDTDEALVPEVARVLGETLQATPAFELQIVGAGAFPHLGRPSVVWVGLEPADVLIGLQAGLEQAFEPLGFARESRPFQPHLTLARIKARPPRELAQLVQQHETASFGSTAVRSIELYQSELRPEGPKYTVLHTAQLRVES